MEIKLYNTIIKLRTEYCSYLGRPPEKIIEPHVN